MTSSCSVEASHPIVSKLLGCVFCSCTHYDIACAACQVSLSTIWAPVVYTPHFSMNGFLKVHTPPTFMLTGCTLANAGQMGHSHRQPYMPSSEQMWAQSQSMHMAGPRPDRHMAMQGGVPMQMSGGYMVPGMMPGMMGGMPMMPAGMPSCLAVLLHSVTSVSPLTHMTHAVVKWLIWLYTASVCACIHARCMSVSTVAFSRAISCAVAGWCRIS